MFNWRIIALKYCVGFCHTTTWISHKYTCVLSLFSLSPPHPSPPGYHRAPDWAPCVIHTCTANSRCLSILHMVMYTSQCCSLSSSPSLTVSQVCSLCLRLYSCPANRLLCTTFLDSISSFQFSCSVMSDSLQPHESQHARPPCPSPTPEVHSDSCPSSQWCHPAILSSVVPFSSCPQSLPALESFPMSQLFICINIWYLFFWFTLLCNRLYIHPPH